MNKIYTCFPEGKHKALTFSYDDGRQEDKRLVALFNTFNLKGTFHLNSGLFAGASQGLQNRLSAEEVAALYRGHEVASHTATHPTLARCPIELVAKEVMTDREALERLVHYPVRGFSYPSASFNEEIKRLLPLLGIEYSRGVGSVTNFSLPKDWYEWYSTCHHNQHLNELGDHFLALDQQQHLFLMYVWGHSYEFTEHDNWNVIETFAEKMAFKEEIWYATNIEIKRYLEEAKQLRFSAAGDFVYNPNAQSIWLNNNGLIVEIQGGKQHALR